MKKLLLLILISLLGLTFPKLTKASEFAGADLTYTCLGGSNYLISMSFYRDCSGVSAPTNVPITFSCSSNPTFNFTASLNPLLGTGQEITQGCSAMPTKCSGSS